MQSVVNNAINVFLAVAEGERDTAAPWYNRYKASVSTLTLKAVQRDHLQRDKIK